MCQVPVPLAQLDVLITGHGLNCRKPSRLQAWSADGGALEDFDRVRLVHSCITIGHACTASLRPCCAKPASKALLI